MPESFLDLESRKTSSYKAKTMVGVMVLCLGGGIVPDACLTRVLLNSAFTVLLSMLIEYRFSYTVICL